MWSCVFPGMASAPPFPISFLLSPRTTAHFTYFLPSLQQLEGKRSNFKTCPLSHFSIKCSSPTQGSTADDSFFQENKELNNQESKGFWKKWKENSAEMSAKLAKLGLAAVLAYGLFDGVTYTSFFVLAFLGYEKSTGNNPAANLQALLGVKALITNILLMAQQSWLEYNNGKSKNTVRTRPRRSCFENSYNHESSEIASNAMQFLSRPWSPSSSDFLQMFSSSNNLLLKDREEDYDAEMLETSTNKHYIKLDLHHMKGWLKSKSPFSFFRSSHQEKKEKLRLQTAKLHALLSLTQLASAISGFASNSSSGILDSQQINNMGSVVSSAAALMTTVCAEAAESLGAGRAQVASAVNSGLAIQTLMDMIAVTATAATCLRGAAILKSRALDHSSTRIPEMLTAGARIWIIMPSGHKEDKWVTLHLKQNQLILSLKRKYFGALTTSKEYKLINIIRECFEAQDEYFVSLKTNNGIIKLLFKDETQSSIWISTISSVLISS